MALSDAKIRKAKPDPKGPTKLVDGGGLYVWIAPQSGAKSWRFDYRLFGKRKTLTIGRYPEITLAEARTAHLADWNRPADLHSAGNMTVPENANRGFLPGVQRLSGP